MNSRDYDLMVKLEREIWEVFGGCPSSYARLLYSGGIDETKMTEVCRRFAARAINVSLVANRLNERHKDGVVFGPNGVIKVFSHEMTVGDLVSAAVAVASDGAQRAHARNE